MITAVVCAKIMGTVDKQGIRSSGVDICFRIRLTAIEHPRRDNNSIANLLTIAATIFILVVLICNMSAWCLPPSITADTVPSRGVICPSSTQGLAQNARCRSSFRTREPNLKLKPLLDQPRAWRRRSYRVNLLVKQRRQGMLESASPTAVGLTACVCAANHSQRCRTSFPSVHA
jgi:hypothetical protein